MTEALHEREATDDSQQRVPHCAVLRWVAWALLIGSLSVVLYVRLRLLNYPLERDEGEYAYAGQLILDGISPYALAYSMKMPGIYLAYAGIMALFGQTPSGIHFGLLLVNLASTLVLFVLAKRFFGLCGAAVAASAYALVSMSPVVNGLSAHATQFVVLPALLGVCWLFRFENSRSLHDCLVSGIFLGIAFLMKQPGMFFGFLGGLYIIWLCLWDDRPDLGARTAPWARLLRRLAVYSLGCFVPFLAVCVWLRIAGVFSRFWFWTFDYARQYVALVTPADARMYFVYALSLLLTSAGLLWVAFVAGLIFLCSTRVESNQRIFLAGFFLFSFFAVCPGLYFRAHYWVLLLPAVSLLIGLSFRRIEEYFATAKPRWIRLAPLVVGAIACAEVLYTCNEVLFKLSPTDACRAVYNRQGFPESQEIARYISQHTKLGDRIAVIGSEPQIYFYAHRKSSTGYIYMYALMEPQPFATRMQQDMIQEIEQNQPAYLVFVSIHNSWQLTPDSNHLLLDWVSNYVSKYMELDGLVQLTGTQTADIAWGTEAATTPLRSDLLISIFKRSASRDRIESGGRDLSLTSVR